MRWRGDQGTKAAQAVTWRQPRWCSGAVVVARRGGQGRPRAGASRCGGGLRLLAKELRRRGFDRLWSSSRGSSGGRGIWCDGGEREAAGSGQRWCGGGEEEKEGASVRRRRLEEGPDPARAGGGG